MRGCRGGRSWFPSGESCLDPMWRVGGAREGPGGCVGASTGSDGLSSLKLEVRSQGVCLGGRGTKGGSWPARICHLLREVVAHLLVSVPPGPRLICTPHHPKPSLWWAQHTFMEWGSRVDWVLRDLAMDPLDNSRMGKPYSWGC